MVMPVSAHFSASTQAWRCTRSRCWARKNKNSAGFHRWRGMEKIGAFGLTEPDHGSDAVALETQVHRDGNEYIILYLNASREET